MVESVIAIAIISICIMVAFMVYINVISTVHSTNYFKAKHKIEYLVFKSIEENDYQDNLFKYEGFTIDKKVQIRAAEHMAEVTFTVSTASKKYIINRLIPYAQE